MYYLNASDVANYWDAYTMKNDVNTISDKEDFSTFERVCARLLLSGCLWLAQCLKKRV